MTLEGVITSKFSKELSFPINKHYAGLCTGQGLSLEDKFLVEARGRAISELQTESINTAEGKKLFELTQAEQYIKVATEYLTKRLDIENDNCWLVDFPNKKERYEFFSESHDKTYQFGEAFCVIDVIAKGLQSIVCRGIKVVGKKEKDGTIKALRNKNKKIIAYPAEFTIKFPTREAIENKTVEWNERGYKIAKGVFELKDEYGQKDFLTEYAQKPIRLGPNGQIMIFEHIVGLDLARFIKEYKDMSLLKFLILAQKEALSSSLFHEDSDRKKAMIHRDVKPSNFLMSIDGDFKTTDYGLLRETEVKDPEEDLTRRIIEKREGSLMLTPFYLSPEAASNAIRGVTIIPKAEAKAQVRYLKPLRKSYKKIPKKEIYTIHNREWVIATEDQSWIDAKIDMQGSFVMLAYHDVGGKRFKRGERFYKAYKDTDEGNIKVVLMDGKSDVYSLGLVFYEMLTGKKPLVYEGAKFPNNGQCVEFVEYLAKRKTKIDIRDYMKYSLTKNSDSKKPLLKNPKIEKMLTPEVCKLVNKCLSPDPDDRYDVISLLKHIYCIRMEEEGNLKKKGFWWRKKYPEVDEKKMWKFFKKTHEDDKKYIGDMVRTVY